MNRFMLRSACLTAAAALLLTHTAYSKELYVDGARGNDSVSYADNSSDRPWRTLGRAVWGSTSRTATVAAQAAQAGDIVTVAAGVYDTSASTGVRMNPIYNPVNNGASGRPIIFRAAANEVVELRASTAPAGQPIIGAMDRAYITWDGFRVNEQYVPTTADTGPVVVWSSNNVTLQNLTIRGYNRGWVDNHNGIRLENTNAIVVRNNSISGYRESQQAYNSSGLTMYRSSNVTIENNDFFEANAGIYLKGFNTTGLVIRNNKFTNVGNGVQLGGAQDVRIYRNIFDNCWESGVTVSIYNDANGINNAIIANNTIMRATGTDFGAVTFRAGSGFFQSIRVANNVLGRSRSGVAVWASTVSPLINSSHNAFYQNETPAMVAWQRMSLGSWQSSYQKDTVWSREVNPSFVNEGGADYHLAPGSPLLQAGVDVLDLDSDGSTSDAINVGAYATGNEIIGRSGAAQVTPNAPASLNVE